MTKEQRAAIWEKWCQAGLPLDAFVQRVLSEAEEAGRKEGRAEAKRERRMHG